MGKYTQGPIAAFTDDSRDVPHTNLVGVVPNTHVVVSLPGRDKREPNVERLVSCWNALAGCDPAKLEGLLAACREAIEQAQYVDDAIGDSTFGERLSAALAAFEKGESDAD